VGDGALPAYLFDPNYYKLGHQLVAEYANRAARALLSEHQQGEGTTGGALATEGRQEADPLIQNVDAVRTELASRSRSRWRMVDPLSNKEVRLYRFLAGTVDPCFRLVAAGLDVLLGDREPVGRFRTPGDELAVTAVHQRLLGTNEIPTPWSPRALYNLACFLSLWMRDTFPDVRSARMHELARRTVPLPHGENSQHPAVWALQEALSGSHGRDRTRMVDTARDDPTLTPLFSDDETSEAVNQLLERNKIPDLNAKESPDPNRSSDEAESPMPSSTELATFWQAVEEERWPPSFARHLLNATRDPEVRAAYALESKAGWRALARTIQTRSG
jgi:hypothetical protein